MAHIITKSHSVVKVFIHSYEFHKAITEINKNNYEGYVSITHCLLTDKCDLFKYFRDNNDEVVCHIARTYSVRLQFNKHCGKIIVYNKLPNLQSNYSDIMKAIDAVMDRITIDMDYLFRKQILPERQYKKRPFNMNFNIDEQLNKIQKTISTQPQKQEKQPTTVQPQKLEQKPQQPLPVQPQQQQQQEQNPFPGLVMVVDKPTPELVSLLFTMNIKYTFLPEFLIKQMLNIQASIPSPISPPIQSPPPVHSHIPKAVLPSFIHNEHREEGEIV